ncbi:MAG: protein kinase domain-containing protein, partial [Planctomycetota bacterium]
MATRRAKCSECGTRFEFEPGADDHVECPHCGASLATKSASDVGKADPLVGRTLGQFEIVEVIGRGGMGAVYKARQTTLDRFVALKVLPRAFAADASFVERFGREARAAAAVDHPHIIGVYEVGHESGCHYIAMELVEGESLGDALQRAGPLPPERALELLKQAASALGEAHDAGIYHRDIKPSNILLDRWGNARVADFGLAKRPGMDVSVTQTGQSLGTPLYMPPEAARGQPLDARSDLYSLGATFYQALAGRPPFQGSSAAELVGKHLEARVPPLQQVAPDTPPALCRIIHRLLRKQPAQRYQSAHKLLAAIGRAESRLAAPPDDVTRSLPGAPRPSTQHRKPVTRKRPPALVAGIGGGALVVVLLLVFLLSRGGGPPKALTPPPPTKASPQPEAGADEKNAAIVLRNARVCAARGEWQKVGTYLDRLESKYGKTRLYAGSRAAIADLREQATAALRPEPSDPIPPPTV